MAEVTKAQVTEVQDANIETNLRKAIAEIKEKVANASHAVLELADTLYKWKQTTAWGEIERELEDRNIVKESVRKKLVAIAQNKTLMKQDLWDNLPIGYNHLYPLSQIKPEKLQQLVQKGKIHAGLTVEESNELKSKFAEKKSSSSRTRTPTTQTYQLKFTVSLEIPSVRSQVKSAIAEFKEHIKTIDPDVVFYE